MLAPLPHALVSVQERLQPLFVLRGNIFSVSRSDHTTLHHGLLCYTLYHHSLYYTLHHPLYYTLHHHQCITHYIITNVLHITSSLMYYTLHHPMYYTLHHQCITHYIIITSLTSIHINPSFHHMQNMWQVPNPEINRYGLS